MSNYVDDFDTYSENLGKNYTKPNDMKHVDKPEEWLGFTLIASKALGHLLKQNEGVVVELSGDMITLLPDTKRVIVYNGDNMIHVIKCEEELSDGQMIMMPENEQK